VQVIPRWEGLAREWQLLREAWQALPDNPLWILAQRMHAHALPRLAKRRRANLALAGLLVGGVYAIAIATIRGVSGQFEAEAILMTTMIGFILPLGVLFLLGSVLNVSQRAQAWLGREREDAKHTALARLDPLLSLSLLTPRDLVSAALRELLPAALLATGVAAVVGYLMLLMSVYMDTRWSEDPTKLLTALGMAPVTFGSVALTGLAGGVILILLCFSLGLNSGSPLQRSALALMLAFHQLTGLWASFIYMGVPDIGNGLGIMVISVPFAVVYLIGAVYFGVHVTTSIRGASAGWLLIVPMVAIFGFWIATGLAAVASFAWTFGSLDPLNGIAAELSSLWFSVNLFVPGCLPAAACIGQGMDDRHMTLAMALNFIAVLTTLGCLVVLAYRAALTCAAIRLRAME
jgi:hypothetical protein